MTLDEIDALRAAAEQEGQRLEFKAGDSLGRQSQQRLELVKDVTGMANAAGGRIIYGLGQVAGPNGTVVAGDLAAVADGAITPDWVSQVLSSNSAPPVRGVEIGEIGVPAARGGGRLLVLDIGQAATAHQCTIDRKYYQRFNATVDAMLDHQIRDVMNRRASPVIEVTMASRPLKRDAALHEYEITFLFQNVGTISLPEWVLEYEVPRAAWGPTQIANVGQEAVEDSNGAEYWRCTLTSDRLGVALGSLHPGQCLRIGGQDAPIASARLLITHKVFLKVQGLPLRWRLFMPNARPLEGKLSFASWCAF
jgi:hypothetical protein